MSRLARWAKVLALPSILAIGLIASNATAAFAGTGYQWDVNYTGVYANAWGGDYGTQVNTYTSTVANNDFTSHSWRGTPYFSLVFTGGTTSDLCIADFGDSSTDARAGLYNCTNGVPWGAYLQEVHCTAAGQPGYEFYDVHWGGYLGPSGSSDGAAWYLNKPTPWCLTKDPPAQRS
jgi:hypothetical protein